MAWGGVSCALLLRILKKLGKSEANLATQTECYKEGSKIELLFKSFRVNNSDKGEFMSLKDTKIF